MRLVWAAIGSICPFHAPPNSFVRRLPFLMIRLYFQNENMFSKVDGHRNWLCFFRFGMSAIRFFCSDSSPGLILIFLLTSMDVFVWRKPIDVLAGECGKEVQSTRCDKCWFVMQVLALFN